MFVFPSTEVSVAQCQPTLLTFGGGSPPYIINLVDGNDPTNTLVSFGSFSNTSFTWTTLEPAGTSLLLTIRDSIGETQSSATFTVGNGGNDACLHTSSSASSPSSSGSSASKPVSTSTSTVTSVSETVSTTTSTTATSITPTAPPSTTPTAPSSSKPASSTGGSSLSVSAPAPTSSGGALPTGIPGAAALGALGAIVAALL
ncbi:hypothetical protein B0H17DRAFT_1053186 [Mycena rosella]|uniref:Uncharacterized protein n=1 Tax=Mycena rosella TaxID=1033263 RepID=A0AAD7DQK3_MYCRO|nr:hypothetical protein B0H17DRAFT_1053186 [Mycena rosella]